MITITSKADMNRAVAEAAFCPEPPLSERRAIHESGAWRWESGTTTDCPECDGTGNFYRHDEDGDFLPCDKCDGRGEFKTPHWEPALFATDPAASYALRQKMRELGYKYEQREFDGKITTCFRSAHGTGIALHGDECIAVALAALRALGVEFELREGGDQC